MSIQYMVQQRESNFAKGRKRRYYLIAKNTGRIGRKDLLNYMVINASLTPSEASSALDYLLEAIPHFLKLGKVIDLGDLGNIKATIRSEGSDNEKEATVNKVKEIRIHFTPSKTLKRELQEVTLEKLDPGKERIRSSSPREKSIKLLKKEIEAEQIAEIVRKAFEKELSIAMIAELTGLDEETINRLK